uniref:Uncharacterized protein n=1 Tax=viral metagenome TaxID=1070528 RepID=A0A6H1ZTM0_9ZZZZ
MHKEIIRNCILNKLDSLSWKCEGCPQVSVCEDQSNGGEPRYCRPMIDAALLGENDWITEHNREG